MPLKLTPNLSRHDEIYEALLRLHDGLSPEDSARMNFRLLLILMNHIGDEETIRQAFAAARAAAQGDGR